MTGVGAIYDRDWFNRKPSPSDELPYQIYQSLNTLHRKVDLLMTQSNATQADIDALTTQVTNDDTEIQAAVAALQAEIVSLQGQGVDVSGLQAAVAKLTTDATADQPAPVT